MKISQDVSQMRIKKPVQKNKTVTVVDNVLPENTLENRVGMYWMTSSQPYTVLFSEIKFNDLKGLSDQKKFC